MNDPRNAPRTMTLPHESDYLAPDDSEIRQLLTMEGGGLCHCTLPAGKTSRPVCHDHVQEIWHVLEGDGEVWREDVEATVRVNPGSCLTIMPKKSFQFRNLGDGPLRILISTMPPWPGPHEARDSSGPWSVERHEDGD